MANDTRTADLNASPFVTEIVEADDGSIVILTMHRDNPRVYSASAITREIFPDAHRLIKEAILNQREALLANSKVTLVH